MGHMKWEVWFAYNILKSRQFKWLWHQNFFSDYYSALNIQIQTLKIVLPRITVDEKQIFFALQMGFDSFSKHQIC